MSLVSGILHSWFSCFSGHSVCALFGELLFICMCPEYRCFLLQLHIVFEFLFVSNCIVLSATVRPEMPKSLPLVLIRYLSLRLNTKLPGGHPHWQIHQHFMLSCVSRTGYPSSTQARSPWDPLCCCLLFVAGTLCNKPPKAPTSCSCLSSPPIDGVLDLVICF